ncbi:Gfo/Idh/MocA family oxidoreductase [Patescibacteria group bacterium]|nr:Gfo/Idh/MocA family oxidoreductase [Patescibacteria group bacterium]
MKKVRVGILGIAEIAGRYAIPSFQSLENVELVAIASRDSGKAKEFTARHNLEPETYDSLIQRDDIDAIYSPLPVGLQEEWTMKAAQAGKHVICEKSITHSLESAERMIAVSRANGVALYENFVPEFHPQHAEILSIIERGEIGTPRVWTGYDGYPSRSTDDIRYRSDLKGGSLNYAGCYPVFMARKIMRQEPIAVTCTLSRDGADVDVSGSALLEFEHGEALISFGFNHVYQNTYSVWGSKGIVKTNRAFAIPPTLAPTIEIITNDGTKEIRRSVDIPATNQFTKSFDFFCTAVAEGDKKKFEDMYDRILRQATVLEAMRVSARDGRRVVL